MSTRYGIITIDDREGRSGRNKGGTAMVQSHDRFGWLKRADRELEELGAPPVSLARAEVYWDEAAERLVELVLDEFGNEFPEDVLFSRVTAYDIALIALALAAQERDEGWYDVALSKCRERFERRFNRVREQRNLPNVNLSLRWFDCHSDCEL
jgi:predicted Zn-dependent peptidase